MAQCCKLSGVEIFKMKDKRGQKIEHKLLKNWPTYKTDHFINLLNILDPDEIKMLMNGLTWIFI